MGESESMMKFNRPCFIRDVPKLTADELAKLVAAGVIRYPRPQKPKPKSSHNDYMKVYRERKKRMRVSPKARAAAAL